MNKRLAVAIEETNAQEKVAEHFGRCDKFDVYEFNEEKVIVKKESFFNPLTGDHGGACQLPGYIKQFNVSAIIAGGMGHRAVKNFESFGIEVITAPGLPGEQAAELYVNGKLSGYEVCAHEHHHEHHHEHNHGNN